MIAPLFVALFVISVAITIGYYFWTEKKVRSAEQRRLSHLLKNLTPLVPSLQQQLYIQWVLHGGDEPLPIEGSEEPVAKFVTCKVETVPPKTLLKDLFRKLDATKFKLLAVSGSPVIGTIGKSDIIRAYERGLQEPEASMDSLTTVTASDVANTNFTYIRASQSTHEVLRLMIGANKMSMIVLDDQKQPFGIVARTQIAGSLLQKFFTVKVSDEPSLEPPK